MNASDRLIQALDRLCELLDRMWAVEQARTERKWLEKLSEGPQKRWNAQEMPQMAAVRVGTMPKTPVRLADLRPGALFRTVFGGIMAVKTEFGIALLKNGRSMPLPDGYDELVEEIEVP